MTSRKIAEHEIYLQMLHSLERSNYEKASWQLRELREELDANLSSNDIIQIEKLSALISARISLKSGQTPKHLEWMKGENETDPFLAAEIHLVKGIYFHQMARFEEAELEFNFASQAFQKINNFERSLLCAFNSIICKINLGHVQGNSVFEELRALQVQAEQKNVSKRILGLIHRQKSYCFKMMNKLNAAVFEGELAVQFLEIHGPLSDYHLALLNLVEISLLQGKRDLAKTFYEMIMGEVDERVQFARNWLRSLLFEENIEIVPGIQDDPHFKERFVLWQKPTPGVTEIVSKIEKTAEKNIEDTSISIQWQDELAKLKSGQLQIGFRKNGKEHLILSLLHKKPHSKEFLTECLWPGLRELGSRDNSLHQLISRINKKVGMKIIFFEDDLYRLQLPAV